MLTEKTAQVIIECDELAKTLKVFNEIHNKISPVCFNNGKPLSALSLPKRVHSVKGKLNARWLAHH